MRVRMLTLMANPNGVAQPGEEVDVAEELGQALVTGGFAELVDAGPEQGLPEVAAMAPAEKAVKAAPKRRTGRGRAQKDAEEG